MDDAKVIAIVLLAVFGNLFLFSLVVTYVRQRLRTQALQRNTSARYQSRAHKRLENKKRVWAMFGLTYEGTIDDVRQSDDEDDDEVVHEKVVTKHHTGTVYIENTEGENAYPPPPYIPGLAELGPRDGLWGLRPVPLDPPQQPERFHDNRRDNDELTTVCIVSPRPQRHIHLRSPELVMTSPLRRSETTRSAHARRYSAPPVPLRSPENHPPPPSDQGPYVTEPQLPVAGSEPPLSPRRLDSISRRHNETRV